MLLILYEVGNVRLFLQVLTFIICYVYILFSSPYIKQLYPWKGTNIHDFIYRHANWVTGVACI